MPNLDEARLKCQDIGVIQRKALRRTFPLDLPVGSRTPAIAINKEAEVRIVEQELPVKTLYVNRLHTFLAGYEIERGVGLVEQGLPLGGLKGDDFEAASAAHT